MRRRKPETAHDGVAEPALWAGVACALITAIKIVEYTGNVSAHAARAVGVTDIAGGHRAGAAGAHGRWPCAHLGHSARVAWHRHAMGTPYILFLGNSHPNRPNDDGAVAPQCFRICLPLLTRACL